MRKPERISLTTRAFASDPRLRPYLKSYNAHHEELIRFIDHPRVQKNGLGLAGHFHGMVPTRIQVLGETELSYLSSLELSAREKALKAFFSMHLSCVLLTKNHTPDPLIQKIALETKTPLFVSSARTSETINLVHAVLDDRLAPHTEEHGVLVDVFGIGLLLLGESGIGKSECALELVLRGHRLVADDIVACDYRPPGMIFGAAKGVLRNHLEIRGLGILNIKDLFGVTAVRGRKRIDVIVKLVPWKDGMVVDRLGVEEHSYSLLSVPIRLITLPVKQGRDMGSLLEVAARNELLRQAGKHSAREFVESLKTQNVESTEDFLDDDPSQNPRHVPSDVAPAPESSVSLISSFSESRESATLLPNLTGDLDPEE